MHPFIIKPFKSVSNKKYVIYKINHIDYCWYVLTINLKVKKKS